MLTLATLGVRLVGLDWGLPHGLEPDAEVTTQLEYLRGHRKGKQRLTDFATYPLLPAYLALATTRPREPLLDEAQLSLDAHLERASDDIRDVRLTVAWTSTLAIPACFLIARRFLSTGWSLFAAALAASSLLGALFGQQARPHALAASGVAWTVLLCLRLRERADLASYVAVGVAASLTIGSLQSGVAVLLPLAGAHALAVREAAAGHRLRQAARGLVPAVMIAASLPFSYPFSFGSLGSFSLGSVYAAAPDSPRAEADRIVSGNHSLELAWFDGAGFEQLLRGLWRYEPALLLLSVAAASLWVARRARLPARGSRARADLLVIASYALPYALVIGVFRETYERFLVPLVPFLACASAWGLFQLTRRRLERQAGWLVAAALCFPTAATLRLAWLRTRPDTVQQATAWIQEHADKEPIFLAPVPSTGRGDSSLELPLLRTARTIDRLGLRPSTCYSPWLHYQRQQAAPGGPDARFDIRWVFLRPPWIGVEAQGGSAGYLRRNPLDFFNDSGTDGLFVIEPHVARTGKRKMVELTSAVRGLGNELARFSPDPPGRDFALPLLPQDRYQDGARWPHYALRCLTARSLGPVVEVYRLDPERLATARAARPPRAD